MNTMTDRTLFAHALDGRPKNPDIELHTLRSLFSYDENSGIVRNKITRSSNARQGDAVGSLEARGYLRMKVCGRQIYVHRLVWALFYGEWPANLIDHINGNKSDNRICNLRDVDFQTNVQNITAPTVRNRSGFRGVHWDKYNKKWRASVKFNGRSIFAGLFDDVKEASDAYWQCKRKTHLGLSQ